METSFLQTAHKLYEEIASEKYKDDDGGPTRKGRRPSSMLSRCLHSAVIGQRESRARRNTCALYTREKNELLPLDSLNTRGSR